MFLAWADSKVEGARRMNVASDHQVGRGGTGGKARGDSPYPQVTDLRIPIHTGDNGQWTYPPTHW